MYFLLKSVFLMNFYFSLLMSYDRCKNKLSTCKSKIQQNILNKKRLNFSTKFSILPSF